MVRTQHVQQDFKTPDRMQYTEIAKNYLHGYVNLREWHKYVNSLYLYHLVV